MKKKKPRLATRKAAKLQRKRHRKASTASRRKPNIDDMRLLPAGRYAVLDPSDPGWKAFRDPDAMRAMLRHTDLDYLGTERWMDKLAAWGLMEKHEGEEGAEYGLTAKGIEWAEAGMPELPQDRQNRVAPETVLGDAEGLAEFFAQHQTRFRRDEVIVVATWFKMLEKDTFTPTDIAAAFEQLGRPHTAREIYLDLRFMARTGVDINLSFGLYAITTPGIERAKRLFVGPRKVVEQPVSDQDADPGTLSAPKAPVAKDAEGSDEHVDAETGDTTPPVTP